MPRRPPATEPHPFVLGEVRQDRRGARLAYCATCGTAARGRMNLRTHPPAASPAEAEPQLSPTPEPAPWQPPKAPPRRRGRRPGYMTPAWELRLLAIALDRAILAGPDRVGWRPLLRIQDLRKVLEEAGLPPEPAHELTPVPSAAGDGESPPAAEDSAPPPPAPQLSAYGHVQQSTKARARQATKAIRDPQTRALAVRAVSLGASIRRNGQGHLVLEGGPLRTRLTVSGSSNGRGRAWPNVRAAAKRAGLDVEGL